MDLDELDMALDAVHDYAGLASVLKATAASIGMQHYAAARLHGKDYAHLLQTIHTAPASHAERCDAPDYWRNSSLVRRLLGTAAPVFYEGNVDWAPPADIPGFEHGVGVCALEGRGATLLFLSRPGPAVAAHEQRDCAMAAMLTATRVQICLARLHLKACPLSARQLDCLRYALAGHTAAETARALDLSARTVEQYLTRAREHLKTPNTLATSVYAIDQGWITTAEVYPLMAAA